MPEYIEREKVLSKAAPVEGCFSDMISAYDVIMLPAAYFAPFVHGKWILEAHDEMVNYRWNVTAECSECCDEQKEIWAGFFPNVPPSIARDAALISAESVKLSNYCPNCGAKMDMRSTVNNNANKEIG